MLLKLNLSRLRVLCLYFQRDLMTSFIPVLIGLEGIYPSADRIVAAAVIATQTQHLGNET